MNSIVFIDTEIHSKSKKIIDIGSVREDDSPFHSNSVIDFIRFIKGSKFICGHNIFNHDLKYIKSAIKDAQIKDLNIIDTLFLSPLMFPAKPYHALLKDDKLQTEEMNNPLNDSIKAKNLFYDEVEAFKNIDEELKSIFYILLKDKDKFSAFFDYVGYKSVETNVEKLIDNRFHSLMCKNANISKIISECSIELAYCLALINARSRYSITPPWVLKNFPETKRIMFLLRNKPCLKGCPYCDEALDIHKGLKRFFGFNSFRKYGGQPLQEKAAKAAVENKSLLAIFPTGGGKSITFQLPALMSGVNSKGLTVVISPLQSLMKDQVDNLEKVGITEAVTINGLLDPIERAKSFERVENGSASILYISPESLRSKTIERLLLGRNVVRFVIDEAHCFSAWGQDFRVDYLYIGDFIKAMQKKKNLEETIPVSCFTATAKQKVIEDIRNYFKDKLSLDLEVFRSKASRTNLNYKVFMKEGKEDKYNCVRELIEEKECPTIVYVSRTRLAYSLAERLTKDGYRAKPYHGKMDKQEKTENQDAFIKGQVQIIVATSAFGMGVDKKDVGMVIHYEISDSLENYVQEAGRAGRDENISADCFVLFDDEDLSKHFILLNQTKLSIKEIQQVWKAIKGITRFRSTVSQSALEIARKAGWDDSIVEIETRVKTAIAALEDAGYIKRGQNMPKVYANSILTKNAYQAICKINGSDKFNEKERENAVRIIKKLFSTKSSKQIDDEEAEARVDYISDHLAIEKSEVIKIVNLLREENILADMKDLKVFIKKGEAKNRLMGILKTFWSIEKFLLSILEYGEKVYHIKELNEQAEEEGIENISSNMIKTIINFWTIKGWVKKQTVSHSKEHVAILCLCEREILKERLTKRYEVAQFILEYLYDKKDKKDEKNQEVIDFSICELKKAFEKRITLFNTKVTNDDIEDTLFYMSKVGVLSIEGGFLVLYNPMQIERIEKDNKKRYRLEHYEKLKEYYENKGQQIHIVGEYAKKMISDYKEALQFVDDYFQLNYNSFLNKYFKGNRKNEIKRNITPAKFRQIFGELSPTQLKIINDNESDCIVVAAGPGSGKTRILVHKLASLMLIEDVKHEQLLMVTFSRSAATEFKKRLIKLIGNAANFIDIKTFHSYCFDLLGRVGSLEKSGEVIREAVKKIKKREAESGKITKTVLVIDEAQDMDADEFALIDALMEYNEDMRIIAVGDDDQNIYEFRGSSSKHLEYLIREKRAKVYELLENYRSKNNLVDFTNQFAKKIPNRLKNTPIVPVQSDNGKIEIVRHRGSRLIVPLVNNIVSEGLSGTTCILTRTNEEALQITALLIKNGMQAKLIQSNEGFNIYNLLEVQFFLNQLEIEEGKMISGETWIEAKRKLIETYNKSLNLELCINIIKDFEAVNPENKYKSDLKIFIRESKLEDFYGGKVETIFVSTFHKAKGREFDNVFLMLNQFNIRTDENIRLLYVAMTRAKQNLTIHYNEDYLDFIKTDELKRFYDSKVYSLPDKLAMQLGFKDVWLDFFADCQNLIFHLKAGDELIINDDYCCNLKGQKLLKFSKYFMSRVQSIKEKGYIPKMAKIKFIVYWKRENTDYQIRIILPEVYFEGQA
ncbi:RecQ family ATP-dependent DNA helicase [Herbivorax sp. ANBcel31]|uniref:RecQ family ATP-dependent DNA helicase n=1 Tax=Herbivorax sp. ANBcel31 TaxID=3069754 RepID=UPI0027B5FBCE|nr:RecQ family ATP-dependent DNA helicase [Herbivorax sp. ANBcel31]MDQ2087315.1 RecQ family ATP-dependent DNA helicase [Herbivorax sp. ANBcel31]